MVKNTPARRDIFPVMREIQTRWMDVDIYGHINNVEYFSYIDSAVNGWYIDIGALDLANSQQVYLVVESGCTFMREIRFPDQITVGFRIERLGNSSVSYQTALFCNDDTDACAQGRYIHVLVDRQTRRSVTIPQKHRDLLAEAMFDTSG